MAKILIVDDSKTSRKFLRAALESAGHTIVGEAVNGQDGIDKYRELLPDIVTMDITMPVMDGLEAVKDIMLEYPEAKVVMVTSAGQQVNIMEALKRGACDFIQKPFDEEIILEIIERVLS